MEQRTENAEIQSLFRAACAIIKTEINAGGVIPMDVQVGDILTMKKPHPCGSKQWKAEKNIRSIEREGETIC